MKNLMFIDKFMAKSEAIEAELGLNPPDSIYDLVRMTVAAMDKDDAQTEPVFDWIASTHRLGGGLLTTITATRSTDVDKIEVWNALFYYTTDLMATVDVLDEEHRFLFAKRLIFAMTPLGEEHYVNTTF